MELKKAWDLRRFVACVYFMALAIYLVIGLQPVEATHYNIVAELNIPSINLTSDVAALKLVNRNLETPDTIAGSYTRARNKTLLIGHASSVFARLKYLPIGEKVIYDGLAYRVKDAVVMAKNEINMDELLLPADVNTLVIMTCAGEDLGGGDATHRLILTAEAI